MTFNTIRRHSCRCGSLAIVIILVVFVAEARAVTINWVPVGNAGNAADTTTGFGAVSNNYNIDEYDVTEIQYTAFLNAKDPTGADPLSLYNPIMDGNYGGLEYNSANANGSKYSVIPGDENLPVIAITWFDAIRFANWLDNGQGNGSTETGAYTLLGDTPTPSNANTITRNAGAKVFLPTVNEWYKAAYYNPATASYFTYATSSNTLPTPSGPTATPNSANYYSGNGIIGTVTSVGAYSGTASPYGAFDMAGDVWQWTQDSLESEPTDRYMRGASFESSEIFLPSSIQELGGAASFSAAFGFRVASVPEPSTAVLAALACGLMLGWRKRLKRCQA